MSVTRTASLLWKEDEKQFPIPKCDDVAEHEWDEDLISFEPFTLQNITEHHVKFCPECRCCYVMGEQVIAWFSKAGSTCPNCGTSITMEDLLDLPVPQWKRSYETWKQERLISMSVQPPEQASLPRKPDLDSALSAKIARHLTKTVETFYLYLKYDNVLWQASLAVQHWADQLTKDLTLIGPLVNNLKKKLFAKTTKLLDEQITQATFFKESQVILPMFQREPWKKPDREPPPDAPTSIASRDRVHKLKKDFTEISDLFRKSAEDNFPSLSYISNLLKSKQLELTVTSTLQPVTFTLQPVTYKAWYHFKGRLYHFEGKVSAHEHL